MAASENCGKAAIVLVPTTNSIRIVDAQEHSSSGHESLFVVKFVDGNPLPDTWLCLLEKAAYGRERVVSPWLRISTTPDREKVNMEIQMITVGSLASISHDPLMPKRRRLRAKGESEEPAKEGSARHVVVKIVVARTRFFVPCLRGAVRTLLPS